MTEEVGEEGRPAMPTSEDSERMRKTEAETLRRELAILQEEFDKLPPDEAQARRTAIKDSLRGMN